MIPFEDLVAALDNWRMRKGMPATTTDVPAAPAAVRAAPAPAPFVMPTSAPAVAPRPVSTTAIPTTESDVMSIDDAEVEDEMYENEGQDFAMNFAPASGNPTGAVSGSIGEDSYDDVLPPAAVAAPVPAPLYDDPGTGPNTGTFDDPAYDDDVPLQAAPEPAPPPPEAFDEEAEDEDWAKLYPGMGGGGAPGPDTMDADQDVIDEATVVGTPEPKR